MQKTQNNSSIIQRWDRMSREEKAGLILLLCAIILGALVRLLYIAGSDFPINDGGLFFTMTRDLQANGFLIPKVTSYNGGGLPFAYPPLAGLPGGITQFNFRLAAYWIDTLVTADIQSALHPGFLFVFPPIDERPGEGRDRHIILCAPTPGI